MLWCWCQLPLCRLLALRPPSQDGPEGYLEGSRHPWGPPAPPAQGGFVVKGVQSQSWATAPCRPWCAQRGSSACPKLGKGPAPKCLPVAPVEGIPLPLAAGIAPQGLSIHLSLSPEMQGRELWLSSPPELAAGWEPLARQLGHRTCRGSSVMPGTVAQPQKQEAVSASFLPPQENHRLTGPGRKRRGGRKCSCVVGFWMKPGWR